MSHTKRMPQDLCLIRCVRFALNLFLFYTLPFKLKTHFLFFATEFTYPSIFLLKPYVSIQIFLQTHFLHAITFTYTVTFRKYMTEICGGRWCCATMRWSPATEHVKVAITRVCRPLSGGVVPFGGSICEGSARGLHPFLLISSRSELSTRLGTRLG